MTIESQPWPSEPPRITDERVTVGAGMVRCNVCGEPVPVTVEMWVGYDDDGDYSLFADPNIMDLELHQAVHDLAACIHCGNDDPTGGYRLCMDCLEEHGADYGET